MPAKKTSYKELNELLEEIIDKLQAPGTDVDEAIKEYERATVVIEQLKDYLKTTENKITKIQASWDKKPKG